MKLFVTGGTGSLGRAVIAWALKGTEVERVVCFSHGEFPQMMMEATREYQDSRLRLFIGDVRDPSRLLDAMVGCDAVVHTAALKYVSGGVYNPGEILKTNVYGTENVIRAATERGVQRVLCITSDKGCAPVNMYGASKLMVERYATAQNAVSFPRGTRVACLRLGNLLWSRGSVAHRFNSCTRQGLPMRLTDDRMTRFGIRLSAAAALIGNLLPQIRGGEIFVPDLPAFRIRDVAEAVWRRYIPERTDVPIDVVGHRQGGERLYELLLTPEEISHAVYRKDDALYVVEPQIRSWDREAWDGSPPGITELRSDRPGRWASLQDLIRSLDELDPGLPSA